MPDSRRVAGAALLVVPAGLMVYFAFNSGGFYPGAPAYASVILCVFLALRVLGAENPFEGVGRFVAAAAVALALYTLLTLLSESWSHAQGGAIVEFDRALVYLLAFVLFGTLARSRQRLVWIVRLLTAAIVFVCACGLITRILPRLWPTAPNFANNRLSFPVTYWNVLGLLAAIGAVLCLYLASDERQARAVRILGAAGFPVAATTLYFTFSRGSIAVCVIALVAYGVLGRPRTLLSAVLSVGPPTAVALIVAYDANLLATPHPTTAGAVVQGHHVAIALAAGVILAGALRAALAVWLDPRLQRLRLPSRNRRRTVRIAWGSLAVIAAISIVALNGAIAHEYHRFLSPTHPGNPTDLRSRLTDPGNNSRLEIWRVAWHQFKAAPVLGHGAGTFGDTFAQHRPDTLFVSDSHSLYLETLDELGVLGFVLLLVVIVTILVRTAWRARGPDRLLYAALFAVMLAWALESAIDWDWEMPVVTVLFFALGGCVLARRLRPASATAADVAGAPPEAEVLRRPSARVAIAAGCILLAVAPAYVWLSQRKLNQAQSSFRAGDCRSATRNALSSISILGVRPEAYEVVAYCDLRRDLPELALAAIQKAAALDPNNWNYAYDSSVIRAAAGWNPMPAAWRALTLNPREPLVQHAWETFIDDSPTQWQSDGKAIADAFRSL